MDDTPHLPYKQCASMRNCIAAWNQYQNARSTAHAMDLHTLDNTGEDMKWFYEWRLKRVRAEIAALEHVTKIRLQDDYTGHSRLRVLQKVEANLQKRLGKYAGTPARKEAPQAPGDLKQST